MPAAFKILLIFASILALARTRAPLGLLLVAGGCVLNLWAGLTLGETGRNLLYALTAAELWLFVIVTAMIIEIGRFMTEDRNAGEIIGAAQRWGGRHGRATAVATLPAVIGLVPMPAGALFSAPFVEQAGARVDVTPAWKSAVNYWFRHVWEYWWPLYPGVIVAMSVFRMPAWRFIAAEILYSPVAIAAGYFFLVRPHVRELGDTATTRTGSNRRAAFIATPIVLVVASLFLLPPVFEWAWPGMDTQLRKLGSLVAGLSAALVLVAVDEWRHAAGPEQAGGKRPRRFRLFAGVLRRKSLHVLVTLAGVLVFKAMLTGSGLLPAAGEDLSRSGIPVALVVAALPLLAGFVTGLAVGFTGASLPLVVGLLEAEATGLTPMATLVLSYGFGYMGMMLSPVHLCLLVTRDYFESELFAIYRRILPCVGAILVYCVAAYLVLSALGL